MKISCVIGENFSDILKFENAVERRIATDINKAALISDNKQNLILCKKYGLKYILIDEVYKTDIDL